MKFMVRSVVFYLKFHLESHCPNRLAEDNAVNHLPIFSSTFS